MSSLQSNVGLVFCKVMHGHGPVTFFKSTGPQFCNYHMDYSQQSTNMIYIIYFKWNIYRKIKLVWTGYEYVGNK